MKIAVFSDIHANLVAFANVLADAKAQGCERFVCLGDIVGYGYDPVACVRICQDNNIECIMGNHDAGLAGLISLRWFSDFAENGVLRHRKEISDKDKAWIRDLPYLKKEDFGLKRTAFAHGTLSNPIAFDYINSSWEAIMELKCMKARGCDLLFVGHTHYAEAYCWDMDEHLWNFDVDNAPDLSINLKNYAQTIVLVGSVGYPRSQDASYYTIFDTEELRVTYRKLPFDFDVYVSNMKSKGIAIPMWLSARAEERNENAVQENPVYAGDCVSIAKLQHPI